MSWKNERWQELGLLPCIMGCGLTGAVLWCSLFCRKFGGNN